MTYMQNTHNRPAPDALEAPSLRQRIEKGLRSSFPFVAAVKAARRLVTPPRRVRYALRFHWTFVSRIDDVWVRFHNSAFRFETELFWCSLG